MISLTLRSFAPGDAEGLGKVFYRAVRDGASPHYTEEQRMAWMPVAPEGEAWRERLADTDTVVAEREGELVGFMNLDGTYLDLAFVLPEVKGQGVSDALYAVLLARALVKGHQCLTVDASEGAKSFFLRMGWRLIARQKIEKQGVMLHNYRMEKSLIRDMAA